MGMVMSGEGEEEQHIYTDTGDAHELHKGAIDTQGSSGRPNAPLFMGLSIYTCHATQARPVPPDPYLHCDHAFKYRAHCYMGRMCPPPDLGRLDV